MSSEQLPPPPAGNAAERLAVIVDAAERAALKVIDDAEKEARRYLEEAKSKADRVVAERLRDLADNLDGAEKVEVAETVEVAEKAPPPRPERHLREVEPEPAEKIAAAEETAAADEESGSSAAARLLATQMAVSGSSRQQIEMRLRNGFEIEDTDEILDAILGPEK
jgi:hypothetical protein